FCGKSLQPFLRGVTLPLESQPIPQVASIWERPDQKGLPQPTSQPRGLPLAVKRFGLSNAFGLHFRAKPISDTLLAPSRSWRLVHVHRHLVCDVSFLRPNPTGRAARLPPLPGVRRLARPRTGSRLRPPSL